MGIFRVAIASAALALGPTTVLCGLTPQAASAQAPSTEVVIPSTGATVSGTQVVLDAGASQGVSQVLFELSGGNLNDYEIATATPTIYGWLAVWNSFGVVNGTYTLQSVATGDGSSVTSAGISITVLNPAPALSIVSPSPDATVSGTQVVLDALGPAGLNQVFFTYYDRYNCPPSDCVIDATPTIYGWIVVLNSTQLPNGSYVLGANCSQCAPGTETTMNVDNPAVVVPSFGATVTGTQVLDCVTPAAGYGSVEFWIEGGGLTGPQELGNGIASYYGWLYEWNTTSMPDNEYSIYCTAVSPSGGTSSSFPIVVFVAN